MNQSIDKEQGLSDSTILLALESSQRCLSVAVRANGKEYTDVVDGHSPQAENLLGCIQRCLDEACLSIDDVGAGVYSRGPGSFTSIRIAMSFLAALRAVRHIPIFAVSSLAALAWRAHDLSRCQRVLVCLDARGGDVYFAAYEIAVRTISCLIKDCHHRPTEFPSATLEKIANMTTDKNTALVGSGWLRHKKELTEAIGSDAIAHAYSSQELYSLRAHASDLIALGVSMGDSDASPLYLRSGL